MTDGKFEQYLSKVKINIENNGKLPWHKGEIEFKVILDTSEWPEFCELVFHLEPSKDGQYEVNGKVYQAVTGQSFHKVPFQIRANIKQEIKLYFTLEFRASSLARGAWETRLEILLPFYHYDYESYGKVEKSIASNFIIRSAQITQVLQTLLHGKQDLQNNTTEKDIRIVWLYGLPNSGKTILLRQLTEWLYRYNHKDKLTYCDQIDQSIESWPFEKQEQLVNLIPVYVNATLQRNETRAKLLTTIHETANLAGFEPIADYEFMCRFNPSYSNSTLIRSLFNNHTSLLILDGFYKSSLASTVFENPKKSPTNSKTTSVETDFHRDLLDLLLEFCVLLSDPLYTDTQQHRLIISDIFPFEMRVQQLGGRAAEWLKKQLCPYVESIAIDFLKDDREGIQTVQQLLAENFSYGYPASRLTQNQIKLLLQQLNGHPALLSACFHHTTDLYRFENDGFQFELQEISKQANDLIGKYKHYKGLDKLIQEFDDLRSRDGEWLEGATKLSKEKLQLLVDYGLLRKVSGKPPIRYTVPSIYQNETI